MCYILLLATSLAELLFKIDLLAILSTLVWTVEVS